MAEFSILNNILKFMESNGVTYKLVEISIDQDLVDEINNVNKRSYTLEELQKATDKCLAHEWLKHSCLGGDRYSHLQITPKGVGAARSKQKSDELKASRSFLKKASDYIDDHKGLFIVLGFLLALSTFALKILGDN
ncbi:hypothetical protein ACF8OI_12240 [Aeromonas bivalvium]|uniref:hypothetical protein n=1 Tax=Aeromonas bivalvium TaxID=440079 RepID=UPI00370A1A09